MGQATLNIGAAKKVSQPFFDWLQQAARKLQEPSDDNVLKASILGGIGGTLEAFAPKGPEDTLENQLSLGSNIAAPAMVRMPKEAILGYAKNFRNRVPQQLEDEGQLPLAEQFDKLAQEYPEWFGQLENVTINPKMEAVGRYTSNVEPDFIARVRSGLYPHSKRITAGLTAPSNNMIEINPQYIRENVDLKSVVPSVSDSTKSVTPMFAKHVSRHEAKHLGQDTLRQLDPGGTSGPNYWLHPDEVEARIFEKGHPLNLDSIMLEMANGKQRTMTDLMENYQFSTPAFMGRKKEIGAAIEKSLQTLIERMGANVNEVPQTLLNFLLRDLR